VVRGGSAVSGAPFLLLTTHPLTVQKKGAPGSYCLAAIPEPRCGRTAESAAIRGIVPPYLKTPEPGKRFHRSEPKNSRRFWVVASGCSTEGR
jgi:hypothetical protein